MSTKNIDRRTFISTTASAAAFTIVPRHVLGGKNHIPPSEKLNIAYIGCGTQGIREMCPLLQNPEVYIKTVCDPNKLTTDYVDWSKNGIRNQVQKTLGDANWGSGFNGIPGGRDIGQQLVEQYYGNQKEISNYKGCTSYEDFRELFAKEQDIDAVKIMTPDHLHATISILAMQKGKHVVIHKPIANRLKEARKTIDTARKTGMRTHLLAWSKISGNEIVKQWINEGAIGTLQQIHNWSNRPVWPQWTSNPTEKPPIPDGFNWDLWLGLVPDRPYHPDYTHAVFRGWYDFGAGSIADMGHYSLWPLFLSLGIKTPATSAEAWGTTTSEVVDHVSRRVRNDVAFPYSSIIRFTFPQQESLPPFELFWYDGGMRPLTPPEMDEDDQSLPPEGMMFVGDKGKILASYHCENPRIIPDSKMKSFLGNREMPKPIKDRDEKNWISAFKNNVESPGSFLYAGPVTETILLGGVALRARKKVVYDPVNMKITNNLSANKFLTREYRKGWEI